MSSPLGGLAALGAPGRGLAALGAPDRARSAGSPDPAEADAQSGRAERAALAGYLREVASNITDENAQALLDVLADHGVISKEQLKDLIRTGTIRDHARSIAAGLAVYLNSFAVGIATAAGVALASPGAAPLAGNSVAAFLNPVAQDLVKDGGLTARYNPMAPPVGAKWSLSGKAGTAQTGDMPFRNFVSAYSITNAIATVYPAGPLVNGGIRIGAGAVAASATGRDARASLEAKETFAGNRTADGQLKGQKWLNAADLADTRRKIETLQQGTARAAFGYGLDVLKAYRHYPRAVARNIGSPRPLANFAALSPHTLLVGLKAVAPKGVGPILQQVADVLLIAGWGFRQQIEGRLSVGAFTHVDAQKRGSDACDALVAAIRRCHAGDVERGATDEVAPGITDRPIAAHEQTVDIEDETSAPRPPMGGPMSRLV